MNGQRSLHVGDTLGPFGYTITEELADIHLESVGNEDPRFEKSSAVDRRMVPPCFTARDYVYLLLQEKTWGAGGIQTAQESEFFNPAYAGQRLVCRGQVVDQFIKKGRTFTVIEYWINDVGGNPIARHRFTGMTFKNREAS
jgi:hypothetical protein